MTLVLVVAVKNIKSVMERKCDLQVGVKILLKNKDNKYLLVRRSQLKYPEVENRWDIVGGRIDPGVTLMENLAREVREETGLTIVGQPKLVAAQDILRNAGKHVVRLTYVGETDSDKVVLDEAENDTYKWHEAQELISMGGLNPYLQELLDRGVLAEFLLL